MQIPRMSTKNARILGIRLDATDAARVAKFEQDTHIEGVSLARAALKAALSYYEQHGSLALPLRLVEAVAEEPLSPPAEKKVSAASATPEPAPELESSRLRRQLTAAAKGSSSTQ